MPISHSPAPSPEVKGEPPSGHPTQFGWWIVAVESPKFTKEGDLIYEVTWRHSERREDARIPYCVRSSWHDAVMVSPRDGYVPHELWTVSVSFVRASIQMLNRT